MADLTASGATPAVIWDDTDVAAIDWKMISGSGPIVLQSRLGAGAYGDVFEWSHSTSDTNKSYRDFAIITSEPTLTFDDSDGATYDYRIRANTGVIYFEENGTGSWVTNFKIDSDYAFALNGMVSGTNNRNDALQWRLFTGALGAASPCVVDVTNGTERKIIGATVMVTTATSDDVDATYGLYDYRTAAAGSGGFYVKIERGTAGGADEVKIYFDPADFDDASRYKIVAFYSPTI